MANMLDACPYRNSSPNVLVMPPAEMWLCEDPADTLNLARNWCVLVQRQMHTGLVVWVRPFRRACRERWAEAGGRTWDNAH